METEGLKLRLIITTIIGVSIISLASGATPAPHSPGAPPHQGGQHQPQQPHQSDLFIGLPSATEAEFLGIGEGAYSGGHHGYGCRDEGEDAPVCDGAADERTATEAMWEELESDDYTSRSTVCEFGAPLWTVRRALGALLDGTAADLDGMADRAPWFQAFPGTQQFPIGAEITNIVYKYNEFGTVGVVMSTSPWPIWDWSGNAPQSDSDYILIAETTGRSTFRDGQERDHSARR